MRRKDVANLCLFHFFSPFHIHSSSRSPLLSFLFRPFSPEKKLTAYHFLDKNSELLQFKKKEICVLRERKHEQNDFYLFEVLSNEVLNPCAPRNSVACKQQHVQIKLNTHRRRRRNSTVELSCVASVVCIGFNTNVKPILDSQIPTINLRRGGYVFVGFCVCL